MRASINNTLLKNLPEGPVDVYDTRLTGFVLRVGRTGKASYRVQYARGKWLKLGRSVDLKPAEAREQARKVLGDAAKGRDPANERRRQKAATFREYLNRVYEPWLLAHRKDGAATAARLRRFDKTLGGKRLPDITPWLIEKWRSGRIKAGRKPATINRDLGAVKAALNRALEWGYIDANPIANVKPAKTDNVARVRWLDGGEAQRLRAALAEREDESRRERARANEWREARGYPTMADLYAVPFVDHVRPLVLLALNTGMRRGELFNLRWQDVDLARAQLTVAGAGAKSGQTRHLPLNAEAAAVLEGWQESTGRAEGLVFPGAGGGRLDNINTAWRGVLKRAGITGFRFHDIRHTFASWLVMAGADLYTLRDLLGHSTIAMTERYAHLAPAHKAEAVARLGSPPARDVQDSINLDA